MRIQDLKWENSQRPAYAGLFILNFKGETEGNNEIMFTECENLKISDLQNISCSQDYQSLIVVQVVRT